MIKITRPENCCGCSACAQRCPKQCITMEEDPEGFLYPRIDLSKCIDCKLCEKVCPIINPNEDKQPLEVYATINPDEETRKQSSSGGVFTLFATRIIQENGVVFGARFDENGEVKHDYTETLEGLAVFRGSKYVQSRIGNTYQKAESFLKSGKKVLFSGTPCQIAGLKRFLKKDYDNLITVDFICHGVPSPKIWRNYLKATCNQLAGGKDYEIKAINFRNKDKGWKKYNFSLSLNIKDEANGKRYKEFCEPAGNNAYMKGFLGDLYLRPSCHYCAVKSGKSGSDITIADHWGVQKQNPSLDDGKGVSLAFYNTPKGSLYKLLSDTPLSYQEAIKYNRAAVKSYKAHRKRNLFFQKFNEGETDMATLVSQLTKETITAKAIRLTKRIIIKIIRKS